MGIGIVKTQLLPCFVELASDNTPLVREAAVLTLVNLFPYIEKGNILYLFIFSIFFCRRFDRKYHNTFDKKIM